MPQLKDFAKIASSSTGVIRMDRRGDGPPGTQMHVSGAGFPGAVVNFFRGVGAYIAKLCGASKYSEDRAARAQQAYDAFRGALYDAVGPGQAAGILARVVHAPGRITSAEVKQAIAEAKRTQQVNSLGIGFTDSPMHTMKALLATDPNSEPRLIAQRMFEMASIMQEEGMPDHMVMQTAINDGLQARCDELAGAGMSRPQARRVALTEARLFFEEQLLKPGSAAWAVMHCWTIGSERLDKNYVRSMDIVLAMRNVMTTEFPELYAKDPRLDFDDVLMPASRMEADEPFHITQDVKTKKRWLNEQSIWQQLHRYVSTPGVLEGSEVALKVQIWLVESPYYVALPKDEAGKDD
jgi:hypothetical protein